METAQIVALRVAPAPPSRRRPAVDVEGDVILVDHLRVEDRALAAFVASRAESDRVDMADRALRIGLHALQDAGTALDVEFVRREFDALLERNASVNERAAKELDQVLRLNFGDREGRLPRTLEQFLGDQGQLTRLVAELFDESKRDSAIGRLRALLGTYFDGDASRLAQLLDPTRMGAPLYQFRTEMNSAFEKLNDRLTAIEAASSARRQTAAGRAPIPSPRPHHRARRSRFTLRYRRAAAGCGALAPRRRPVAHRRRHAFSHKRRRLYFTGPESFSSVDFQRHTLEHGGRGLHYLGSPRPTRLVRATGAPAARYRHLA